MDFSEYLSGREDAEGAVEALKQCVESYQRAPSFGSVFQVLIKNEDANRLQKGNVLFGGG